MFDVAAESYQRFMGRYSEPLARAFVDLADPQPGQRAVDVGCGPGAVTALLVERLGPDAVTAIDPSASFVAAARERLPDVDVRQAPAESIPLDDDSSDLTLAQLVVHFMTDPVAGVREMARITRPGGFVAASVWDYHGGRAPLSVFWRAVNEVDPGAPDESDLAGARDGHLAEIFRAAGLNDVEATDLTVYVPVAGFDDYWAPYLLGVGPAGKWVTDAGPQRVEQVRRRCAEQLPDGAFEVPASAWVALGRS